MNAGCCQDAGSQNKAQDTHTSAWGYRDGHINAGRCVAAWVLSEVHLSMVNLCVPRCPLPAHNGASMEFSGHLWDVTSHEGSKDFLAVQNCLIIFRAAASKD